MYLCEVIASNSEIQPQEALREISGNHHSSHRDALLRARQASDRLLNAQEIVTPKSLAACLSRVPRKTIADSGCWTNCEVNLCPPPQKLFFSDCDSRSVLLSQLELLENGTRKDVTEEEESARRRAASAYGVATIKAAHASSADLHFLRRHLMELYSEAPGFRRVSPVIGNGPAIDVSDVFVRIKATCARDSCRGGRGQTTSADLRCCCIADGPFECHRDVVGSGRVALFEGTPGIGKTTAAKRICSQQMFPQHVSVFLRAKDCETARREDLIKTALKLFQLGPPQVAKIVDTLAGTPIAWIVDGLDEIDSENAALSINGLINSRAYPNDVVVLNSRSDRGLFAKEYFLNKDVLRWEHKPWDPQAANEYVRRRFPALNDVQLSDVCEAVDRCGVGCVRGLPLMCEIVCGLCDQAVQSPQASQQSSNYLNPAAVYYRCLQELVRRTPDGCSHDIAALASETFAEDINTTSSARQQLYPLPILMQLRSSFREFLYAYHVFTDPSALLELPLSSKHRISWVLLAHMVQHPDTVGVKSAKSTLLSSRRLADIIVERALQRYRTFSSTTTYSAAVSDLVGDRSVDALDQYGDAFVSHLHAALSLYLKNSPRITGDSLCNWLVEGGCAEDRESAGDIVVALLKRHVIVPVPSTAGFVLADTSGWRDTSTAALAVELSTIIDGTSIAAGFAETSITRRLCVECSTLLQRLRGHFELRLPQTMFVQAGYFMNERAVTDLHRWLRARMPAETFRQLCEACAAKMFERSYERGRHEIALEGRILKLLGVNVTLRMVCTLKMPLAVKEILQRAAADADGHSWEAQVMLRALADGNDGAATPSDADPKLQYSAMRAAFRSNNAMPARSAFLC